MKRLILVRHGKSSWKYDVADEKRPLKKRGVRDGKLIANAFSTFVTNLPVMWSSHAVRAHETAKIFQKELEIEELKVKQELYTFNVKDLLAQIKACDDNIYNLMVFGHNPAMTSLVNSIGDKPFDNIPTTGLTIIDFQTDSWKNIKNGKTILHLFPKNLR